jgi:hypothetical protein
MENISEMIEIATLLGLSAYHFETKVFFDDFII